MIGEIESEGIGVGFDLFFLNDYMIDDLDFVLRKGKGLLVRFFVLEVYVVNYVNYIILYLLILFFC